jgi:hypothetical protein
VFILTYTFVPATIKLYICSFPKIIAEVFIFLVVNPDAENEAVPEIDVEVKIKV